MTKFDAFLSKRSTKFHRLTYVTFALLTLLLAIYTFIGISKGFNIFQMTVLLVMPEFLMDYMFVTSALIGNLFILSLLMTGGILLFCFVKQVKLNPWVIFALYLHNLLLYTFSLTTLALALSHISTLTTGTNSENSSIFSLIITFILEPKFFVTLIFLLASMVILPKSNQYIFKNN